METETSTERAKRALEPSATSTFRERKSEKAREKEKRETEGERGRLERGRDKVRERKSER